MNNEEIARKAHVVFNEATGNRRRLAWEDLPRLVRDGWLRVVEMVREDGDGE